VASKGLWPAKAYENEFAYDQNNAGGRRRDPPGLQRVSSAGGVPTVVTTVDPSTGEDTRRWPHFLPDGRHFFYTVSTGPCCPASKPSVIRIGSFDPADAAIPLLHAESSVSYASGHVVFARDDTLMAQPFDPEARQLTGEAFPLAENVSPREFAMWARPCRRMARWCTGVAQVTCCGS
jgi:hypothetical protein